MEKVLPTVRGLCRFLTPGQASYFSDALDCATNVEAAQCLFQLALRDPKGNSDLKEACREAEAILAKILPLGDQWVTPEVFDAGVSLLAGTTCLGLSGKILGVLSKIAKYAPDKARTLSEAGGVEHIWRFESEGTLTRGASVSIMGIERTTCESLCHSRPCRSFFLANVKGFQKVLTVL